MINKQLKTLVIVTIFLTTLFNLTACKRVDLNTKETKPDPVSDSIENTPPQGMSETVSVTEVPVTVAKPKRTALAQPAPKAEVIPAPESVPAPAQQRAASNPNWQPNAAHITRGKQLIMGLQREIGKQPSSAEMQTRLQTHMGVSPEQAKLIIGALAQR